MSSAELTQWYAREQLRAEHAKLQCPGPQAPVMRGLV